ncbi:MAG TPA: hypothetical protein VF734_18740 [Pseudonocardiaceae bacterium]
MEADAAASWGGIQMCGQPGGGQAIEEPIEQAQVHSAHQFGVVLRQRVERAVGECDVAAFDARFETVCLKRAQYGLSGIRVASSTAGCAAEFSAQLVSTLVKSRPARS